MIHTRTCKQCNKEFLSTRSPNEILKGWGKCCSYECMGLFAKTGSSFNCLICSKSFYRKKCEIKKGFTKYCSLKCHGMGIRRPTEWVVDGNIAYFEKHGKRAIIDSVDIPYVKDYCWNISSENYVVSGGGIRLHRLLLDLKNKEQVDHINRNPLDNRRLNLRSVSSKENTLNQGLRKDNRSGYKGVSIRDGKYRAIIQYQGKSYRLGTFKCPIEAAKAYDTKARELFGIYAYLNFPKAALDLARELGKTKEVKQLMKEIGK